jgi:hypothetical protein
MALCSGPPRPILIPMSWSRALHTSQPLTPYPITETHLAAYILSSKAPARSPLPTPPCLRSSVHIGALPKEGRRGTALQRSAPRGAPLCRGTRPPAPRSMRRPPARPRDYPTPRSVGLVRDAVVERFRPAHVDGTMNRHRAHRTGAAPRRKMAMAGR